MRQLCDSQIWEQCSKIKGHTEMTDFSEEICDELGLLMNENVTSYFI